MPGTVQQAQSADGEQFETFARVWQQLAETEPEKMLFRIPTDQSGQVLSFRIRSFVRRAAKIASAFHNLLKIEPGERVAVMVETPADVCLLLHGCWLSQTVPVIVPTDFSDQKIVRLLQQTGSKTVVFEPEFAARIASLTGKLPAVEHWVASGTSHFSSNGPIVKLDEVVLRSESKIPSIPASEAAPDALIIASQGTTGEKHFCVFSQAALLAAARNAASMQPVDATPGGLYWCGLPADSFNGIVHNFLAPMFSPLSSYILTDVNLRQFWEFVYADDLCSCVISQDQLRLIHRRGKARTWLKPDCFQIVLYSDCQLSMPLLANFESRFLTPVRPCYSLIEAGGAITMFPVTEDSSYRNEWLCEFDVPSSGIPMPGVTVQVCGPGGEALGEEYLGFLRVSSPAACSRYLGSGGEDTRLLGRGIIETGDEGYWVRDRTGNLHVFVYGRASEFIERDSNRISPAPANAVLADIRGIEYSRTVGFPNAASGYEIGAFVIPHRAAQLTEESVLALLRVNLEWDECPKVVVFGSRTDSGDLPSRSTIEGLFEQFFHIDYNFDRS